MLKNITYKFHMLKKITYDIYKLDIKIYAYGIKKSNTNL